MHSQEAGVSVGSVEFETRRWLLRANAVLRTIQVAPWLTVLASSDWSRYYHPEVVVVLYVAYAAWCLLLFANAFRKDFISMSWIFGDVLIVWVCVIVVGLSCRPGWATTWQNWTPGPVVGAGILAIMYGGIRFGVVAIGALMATVVISVRQDLAENAGVGALLANLAFLVASAIAALVISRRLNRSASKADQSALVALEARESEARSNERVRQYDILHTNVLTTLTLVARSADALSEALRARCGRDAKYLRSLVNSVVDASPLGLNATLAEVIFAQGAYGLNIHYSADQLPRDLPAELVAAIRGAVTEALNNVVKYAGTSDAWVVATGEDDGSQVTVTVTDRGHGFDLTGVAPGFGLSQSMRERMAEVGGHVEVRSYLGHGTSVEIQWNG